MELLGYLASLFIGISLGLVGAGGSILTVPVMVYLFGVPVMMASSYSLFIVGITSSLGALYQKKRGSVNGKVAALFCAVSLTEVFLIRNFVLPQIPAQLFLLDGVAVTFSFVSMAVFSLLMVAAALAMMKKVPSGSGSPNGRRTKEVFLAAILVGLVTGFLGAGGGFIVIPALVLLLRLPMKEAIGTSLLIIAINSLIGFGLDLQHVTIEWHLLCLVTVLAAVGIFVGMLVGRKISTCQLKISFGWFVLLVGITILINEVSGFMRGI